MTDRTGIEWTDATWNPIGGCTRVSEGCRHCYAEVMAARFSRPGQWGEGLATMQAGQPRWTGKVVLHEHALDRPLRWRRPRRIFVNSTSDLFHEAVPDDWIDRIFAAMALAPQHTFQVLTKRPERMRAYLASDETAGRMIRLLTAGTDGMTIGFALRHCDDGMPGLQLPNVWLGTSVEDQATADARVPHLLATPAAARFVSAEPLLGPLDLRAVWRFCPTHDFPGGFCIGPCPDARRLDWVIVGGESGPGARPMHPDWARSLRDQCAAARVAFYFKQWGEWAPWDDDNWSLPAGVDDVEARDRARIVGGVEFLRVGKRAAGHLLDGRAHREFPR